MTVSNLYASLATACKSRCLIRGSNSEYTGRVKSPCTPARSEVNLYLWFSKSFTYALCGVWDFCNALPSPWGAISNTCCNLSTVAITYFQ